MMTTIQNYIFSDMIIQTCKTYTVIAHSHSHERLDPPPSGQYIYSRECASAICHVMHNLLTHCIFAKNRAIPPI